IAASATGLLRYRRIIDLEQEQLDKLIQPELLTRSGFEALGVALRQLGVPCRVVVQRPSVAEPEDLAAWIEASTHTRDGFLIAHKVHGGHHITVIFWSDGTWFRADPGDGSIMPIALWSLKFSFSGDLAYLIPSAQSIAIIGWGSLIWDPRQL